MEQLPAAVLVILRYLMQQAVSNAPGSQVAMVGPGERGAIERGVLVWLYHATPALNFRRANGPRDLGSDVSIDLSILLTCVGDERRYEPARLLGGCVATLEAHPVLRASDAREALTAIEGHGLALELLLGAWVDLPLVLHNLSISELSQLWGAGGGAKGVSVACRVQAVPCGKTGPVAHG